MANSVCYPRRYQCREIGGSRSRMGFIHCCGALRRTRTYCLIPQEQFVVCEIDYLSKCPVCGNLCVQLTRIDNNDNLTVIKKFNSKGKKFFNKLKKFILYEEKTKDYSKVPVGRFYLNYNEFGVKKRCYSNLKTLKIGKC